MKKTIVGLVGETGSGKDTVADYLEKEYGATLMRFADPIKDTLSIYFDKLSKKDQQWLYGVFKDRFGADILSRAMKKRIEDADNGLIIVNGVRMPSDYEFIREFESSKILYITAQEKIRWQRVTGRGEKSDDQLPFESFQALNEKETEVHVPKIGEKADCIIDNEKDLEYLLIEADKFMKELGVERVAK
ncbi:MAG: AAA family ATPase [Patescibacteria group bacterium]|nr:AAA family ATPase [Patescibacteria group bacterium]